jgi:hypothetical protein
MSGVEDASGGSTLRWPVWTQQSGIYAEALRSLAELNEQCLELLCEQALLGSPQPGPALLAELRTLWCALDVHALRRAALCPYLLLDAGFTRAARWGAARERLVQDRERLPVARAFFSAPRTIPVTRQVLTFAWHLARSDAAAARLLLGMSGQCAQLIAACTVRHIYQLAESEAHWLEPRWPDRLSVWRELLSAALAGEPATLERARLHGLQLLAAQARAAEADPSSDRERQ